MHGWATPEDGRGTIETPPKWWNNKAFSEQNDVSQTGKIFPPLGGDMFGKL